MAKVSASVLSCDTMQMGKQILLAEEGGADYIHVDVMDGVYVENLTFGPQTVCDMKRITDLPVCVHLELFNPERFLRMFAGTGADIFCFQLDACHNPIHFLKEIKSCGMQAGIGIGPAYSVENLRYLMHLVDRLILMSVEPGYGGQVFEESVYGKIRRTKELMEETGHFVPIEIDGGVNTGNGSRLLAAGADVLTAGSAVFGSEDIAENVRKLKALHA